MWKKHSIDIESWDKLDKAPIGGLAPNMEHQVRIPREAIPIIFVPGVMGSRLRHSETKELRWDTGLRFLWWNYSNVEPAVRKLMLIGPSASYDQNYLEVDNDNPIGDGFKGVIKDYRSFLEDLRDHTWLEREPRELFVFPVFAFGYNWTNSNGDSGNALSNRIDQILAEARSVLPCENVILVTHSMGGLVARAASKIRDGSNILGIIHGVQPAIGTPSAYWRMKAGFEAESSIGKAAIASCFLGNSGPGVTALLANSIGGLELLPNKLYRPKWLKIDGNPDKPVSDPYQEIYLVKASVNNKAGYKIKSDEAYWGLVDEKLLTPGVVTSKSKVKGKDAIANEAASDSWSNYESNIGIAKGFHDWLNDYQHPRTWNCYGTELLTADIISLKNGPYTPEYETVTTDPDGYSSIVLEKPRECYPIRGFNSYFQSESGIEMQVSLQQPNGTGDGTVSEYSAKFLTARLPPAKPDHQSFRGVGHQDAYNNDGVQRWAVCAITGLCKEYILEKRTKLSKRK